MRKEKPISDFLWYHISKRFFMILQIIFYCVDETYEEKKNDQFTELGIKQSVLVIPKVHGKPYWVEGGGVNILKNISSYIIY